MVRDMKAMVKAVMATMTNILPMVAMKKAVMAAMATMETMVKWVMVKVAMAAMVTADTALAVMAAVVTAQAVMALAVTVKAVITVKREVLIWAVMVVMVRVMVAGDLMAVISLLFLALMDTTAEDSRGLSTLLNMDPTAMVAVGDGVDGAASGATPTMTSPGLDPCSTTRSSTMKPITWPIFWRSTVINQSMSKL